MMKLIPLQHFFRYFSYSQAIVAAIMIFGGLWLRLTTGWHAASFLFFVWGLSCVYMSKACLFAWKNWFLAGKPDPVLEKKRRKSMVTYIVLGGMVWVFFGLAVIRPGFNTERVYVFDIRRTNQFDLELQRFIKVSIAEGYDPVKKYTDSELVLQGKDFGASMALRMNKLYHTKVTTGSHLHTVNVEGNQYKISLQSELSHYGWSDHETGGGRNNYISSFCQFLVPFTATTLEGEVVPVESLNGFKPSFVERPKLNELRIKIVNGELLVSRFLPVDQFGADSCNQGAYEYSNTTKRTPLGTSSLRSAPIEMVRYLAFPGFNDGVLESSSYKCQR